MVDQETRAAASAAATATGASDPLQHAISELQFHYPTAQQPHQLYVNLSMLRDELVNIIESEIAYGCEDVKSENYISRESIRNNPYYINPLIEKLGKNANIIQYKLNANHTINCLTSHVENNVYQGLIYANQINPNIGINKQTLSSIQPSAPKLSPKNIFNVKSSHDSLIERSDKVCIRIEFRGHNVISSNILHELCINIPGVTSVLEIFYPVSLRYCFIAMKYFQFRHPKQLRINVAVQQVISDNLNSNFNWLKIFPASLQQLNQAKLEAKQQASTDQCHTKPVIQPSQTMKNISEWKKRQTVAQYANNVLIWPKHFNFDPDTNNTKTTAINANMHTHPPNTSRLAVISHMSWELSAATELKS